MEGTEGVKLTVQGFGNPVPATVRSERAGSQSSISSDRNATTVENLAVVAEMTTSNLEKGTGTPLGKVVFVRSAKRQRFPKKNTANTLVRSFSPKLPSSPIPIVETVVIEDVEEEEQRETGVSAGASQHIPPERTDTLVESLDQGALLQRCKSIIDKMKRATLRQKNISNDIKIGLVELEDALDAITYVARIQKRPEAHLSNGTELQEAPDTPNAAGSKKRPATSPAEQKELQEKKIRDETQTPEGAGKALWENPRARRERRRSNLEAKAAECNGPENSRPNDEREVAQKRMRKRRGKRRRFRPEALIIRPAEGKTYAQVLAEMRSKVNPEETEAVVQTIRQTRAGDVLLELGPKSKNKEGFCGALRHALGDQATILTLEPKVSVEIRDLDGFTTVQEVVAALKREIPEAGPIKVNLFPGFRGQQVAITEIEEKWAAKLLNEGRLKIGWVYCRVRERIVVTRCFRCSGYGHMAKNCTGPDRSKLCYKCLAVGHKARGCTAAANCILCNDRGIEQAQLNHFPGSGKCQVYRETLQAVKSRK